MTTSYRVCLLDVRDYDDLPISVEIKVENENKYGFEQWLLANQDNLFEHACSSDGIFEF